MLWEPLKGHLLLGWAGSGGGEGVPEGEKLVPCHCFHHTDSWAWAFASHLTEHPLPITYMHFQPAGPFITLFDADVLIKYLCAGIKPDPAVKWADKDRVHEGRALPHPAL